MFAELHVPVEQQPSVVEFREAPGVITAWVGDERLGECTDVLYEAIIDWKKEVLFSLRIYSSTAEIQTACGATQRMEIPYRVRHWRIPLMPDISTKNTFDCFSASESIKTREFVATGRRSPNGLRLFKEKLDV